LHTAAGEAKKPPRPTGPAALLFLEEESMKTMMRKGVRLATATLLLAGCGGATTTDIEERTDFAVRVPAGFQDTIVASGFDRPTAMEIAPDGRVFILEQGGKAKIVKNGQLLATPFITLSVDSRGERGLLGIAFDPDFDNEPWVYLYLTRTSPTPHNEVIRVRANGDVASGTPEVLLVLNDLSQRTNHNGGAIHFGPDGKLYIGVGENASRENSQRFTNLLGKMLRINKDGSIPTDNPFRQQTDGVNEAIWAIGLRNPFNFAFNRDTGKMLINDVGEFTWEEVNEGVSGSNYGWPNTEGSTNDPRFKSPLHVYGRDQGCSVIGGAFYDVRPAQGGFPASYRNAYFFADYCGGWVKTLDAQGRATAFATGFEYPVDIKVDGEGSLWVVQREGGDLHRIRSAP
jgi:glucose/arabinose dehydrogenase